MAKQIINIGASANDGTGDPLRNAFDKVNDNFNELYTSGGTNGSTLINIFDSNGYLDLSGDPHKVTFYYDTKANLDAVSPSTYHGAVGHAHDTGSLYYAHGSWRRLLADTSAGAISNYSDPLAPYVYANNVTNSETSDYVLKTNADGTYTWVAQGGGGGGGSYADTDVDAHLNVSGAQSNEVLQWSGSDYQWTALPSGGSSANTFGTISVAGQSDVVADSSTDGLTIVAGSNITITTDANADSITINASGGGGGSGTDLNSLSGGTLDVAADSIGFIDADDSNNSKKDTIADFVTAIAGTNLSASNGVLNAAAGYANADVDSHLNTSGASTNEFLQWNGSDYQWASAGGGGSSTLAALTEVNTADLDVHDMAFPATTVHVMTPNGSSAYRSDHYGTTDNPTLYINAGETIAFDLTGVTSSHPFQIETSGGSAYNTGLVHIAPDGTRTTDSNAQGKTSGVLYWKVPGSISGTYKYRCTVHGSMIGDIEIADPSASGGGSGASRVSETETTSSIADGASGSVEYATLGKSFALQKVTVDKQCWVRIYSDTTARTADAGRTQGTDPSDGSGVIAEFIATASGTTTFKITPSIMGWLDNSETEVPVAVQNNSGSAGTVQVTIDVLKLES